MHVQSIQIIAPALSPDIILEPRGEIHFQTA